MHSDNKLAVEFYNVNMFQVFSWLAKMNWIGNLDRIRSSQWKSEKKHEIDACLILLFVSLRMANDVVSMCAIVNISFLSTFLMQRSNLEFFFLIG